MNRKIAAWLSVLMLVAVGAGCDDGNNNGDDTTTDVIDDTTDTLGDITPDTVADTAEDTTADTVEDTGTDSVTDTVEDTVEDTGTDSVTDTVEDPVEDTAADSTADIVEEADVVEDSTTTDATDAPADTLDASDGPTAYTIDDLRSATDGTLTPAMLVEGVYVTYLRPDVSAGNGFYIQGAPTGPAIFVYTDTAGASTIVTQGDLIDITVDEVDTYHGLKQVTSYSALYIDSGGHDLGFLIQDLSAGGTIDEDMESELVSISGATLGHGEGSSYQMAFGTSGASNVYYGGSFGGLWPCPGMTFDVLSIVEEYDAVYSVRAFRDTDFASLDRNECDVYWDFESTSLWDPPTGTDFDPGSLISSVDETTEVSNGSHSTTITWSTTSNRDILVQWSPLVDASVNYTAHVWAHDNDPCGRARLRLREMEPDGSLVGSSVMGTYTEDLDAWVELAEPIEISPGLGGNRLAYSLRFYDVGSCPGGFTSATISVDDFALTQSVAFDVSDGVLDALVPGEPTVPDLMAGIVGSSMTIYSALNDEGILYVQTDKAMTGTSDHILYVWVGVPGSSTVSTPWSKSGTVVGPSTGGMLYALAQEEAGGYCMWQYYDDGASGWSTTGLDGSTTDSCSGSAGTVLEGFIDLTQIPAYTYASEIPAWIGYAVAPYGTNDAGTMVSSSQIPASLDANDDINDTEVLTIHRADLLVGNVVEP